jgi:hypothetical protein
MQVTDILFSERGKVLLTVDITSGEALHTAEAPNMPRILFRLFPYLASQRCFNDRGVSFRKEAEATEVPHLFEHLVMEIQKQAHRTFDATIAGETEWNWTIDPRGRFHVTIGYANEIAALASIRLAERIINALDSKNIANIDVEREIRRIRNLEKLSRQFIPPTRLENTQERLAHNLPPSAKAALESIAKTPINTKSPLPENV